VLIIAGSILAGVNLKLIPADIKKIICSWQTLVIVLGIVLLFNRRKTLCGIFMICIGAFFMVPRLELPCVSVDFVALYWPLLLVMAGIIIIVYCLIRRKYPSCSHHHHYHHRFERHKSNYKQYPVNEDFHKVNIFGYGEYFVIDTEFNGGTLTAVFGGMEVDLRKATLPEGDTFLKIDIVFSGITLFIPENWIIDTQIEVVASGIEDHRVSKPATQGRRLVIFGSAVFSGIEIKN
jgi:predicted membrane protein